MGRLDAGVGADAPDIAAAPRLRRERAQAAAAHRTAHRPVTRTPAAPLRAQAEEASMKPAVVKIAAAVVVMPLICRLVAVTARDALSAQRSDGPPTRVLLHDA